jgi:RNA polymerase sigma-70 factor (ECF subfamily)
METAPTDGQLVTRCRRGDREAFAGLVRRYQAAVHAFILSRVGDFDVAEDLTQETFVAAYLGLKGLQQAERFAQWLRGIASNLSAGWLRRQIREAAYRADPRYGPRAEAADPDPTPDEVLLEREREDAVLCALARLTPRRAAAVALYYSDGLSYR